MTNLTGHRKVTALLTLLLATSSVVAWGPHTEITQAALDVVPNRPALEKYFGPDWRRIAKDYCWIADWREAVRPDHYADDYLFFPGHVHHPSHVMPHVRRTYTPFFKRALQALRTESPQNAARWVGSLLHFIEDSGSPPHTVPYGGPLHGKMERWVDESKVNIRGYRPRLLGETEEEAVKGLHERMEKLIAYSKVRALKLKPILDELKVRRNQPLELESALETARVTADVLHTLFTLGLRKPEKIGARLKGLMNYRAPKGYANVPAKVMLAGTNYGTTTDTKGAFQFKQLPPGMYDVLISATGYKSQRIKNVVLRSGETAKLDVRLKRDEVPDNLVRNPNFGQRWLDKNQRDWWFPDPLQNGRWRSALMRLPIEDSFKVCIAFQKGKTVPVFARWRANPANAGDSRTHRLNLMKTGKEGIATATIRPDENLKPFEKGYLFLEILIASKRPQDVCRHIAVVFAKKVGIVRERSKT